MQRKCHSVRFEPKFFCLLYSLLADCDIRLYDTLSSCMNETYFKWINIYILTYKKMNVCRYYM